MSMSQLSLPSDVTLDSFGCRTPIDDEWKYETLDKQYEGSLAMEKYLQGSGSIDVQAHNDCFESYFNDFHEVKPSNSEFFRISQPNFLQTNLPLRSFEVNFKDAF